VVYMNRLVWVGVIAVAAVLLLTWWLYSTAGDYDTRFKQAGSMIAGQTSQPPPAAAVAEMPGGTAKLPFSASSYEANYTITFTAFFNSITVTMEGWSVVGVGPSGNYSFGVYTASLWGATTYKTATEGNAAYTMTCINRFCTVSKEKWRPAGITSGINVVRTARGPCRHLNYTGVWYEERGMFDPKAPPHHMEGFLGNYTAYICEVNGVILSADLVATASVRGEPVRVVLKMEATKAGPYRPDTYSLILKEVKAANR
jgi:hypothetical protein